MNATAIVLCLLLPLEAVILRMTQRRIFWDLERVGRSRLLAYVLVAPSTIAHELAHAFAAVILRVPFGAQVGGTVELFRPRRHADGGITLGQVSVARTDALRSSLISIAPFLLVPLMMLGINWALLGTVSPIEAAAVIGEIEPWRLALWAVATLTLPLGAFPSPGDHIGVGGGVSLAVLFTLIAVGVHQMYGPTSLLESGAAWSSVLAVPAAVCAFMLLALRPPRTRRSAPLSQPET
ncbi:hypothetical protein [Miltoncostaea oceani]|uniref:hypothetical protein n=1 Tax=Miltoncostaea oceani TaxID=2843216 RepID=UPI001C3CDDD8|nr:hypothetical protein [Miltoncostaea oceani]